MHAFANRWSGPRRFLIVLAVLAAGSFSTAHATINVYTAVLDGPSESPVNASPGIGTATVTVDDVANTMRVQATFSGLTGTVTASHIHAATAVAGTGTAGVATTTPTFAGFPSGVTFGTYDNTLDMTLATSYNPSYVTANGGTPATARTALFAAIAAGKAYLNIHSTTFGGGEIRGFLNAVPCLAIYDEAVVEGNAGKLLMNLKVELGKASPQTITVHYETVNFTASTSDVPPDYTFASGTLTFPPNSTLPQYVPVSIFGDTKNGEGDETFLVNLSNATGGATICDPQGIGKILDDDGPSAALVSQFAVEAVEGGIALRWQFGDPSSIKSSKVERANAQTGPWAAVEAEVLTDGGMLTMVDRSVEAEHTYYYRLAAQLNNGQMLTSGFIAATSGNIVREFALSRISPNPTNGPASIDFAVPQQSQVRLSVLDVQGRVVAVLVDGVVKAGRHQAVWNGNGTHGTTRAGMYFVRFEAGGKSFVKRVALTQ